MIFEDVKLICVDVKKRVCEDGMCRCQDAKMICVVVVKM